MIEIPQHIHLLEEGLEDLCDPFDMTSLKASHPAWEAAFSSDLPEGNPVVVIGPCTSTFDATWTLMKQHSLPAWTTVMAVSQRTGRGQMRRPWVSPAGNIYASLVLPGDSLEGWKGNVLSIIVGYLLCEAANSLGGNVILKWPNDLVQNGRKVGGLLVEDRGGAAVVGVGLNLVSSPPREDMRKGAAMEAGLLELAKSEKNPLYIWVSLVNQAKKTYETMIDKIAPHDFVDLITARLAWLGRTVQVREHGHETYRAIILGITQDGGLLLDRNGTEYTLTSGSILPI